MCSSLPNKLSKKKSKKQKQKKETQKTQKENTQMDFHGFYGQLIWVCIFVYIV